MTANGVLCLLLLFAAASDGLEKSINNNAETHRDRLGQWSYGTENGINIATNMVRGLDHIKNGRLNKGMAFTLEERQMFGIHGLLPPRIKTQEEQLKLCQLNIDMCNNELQKYVYLMDLQDRNERLFYRFLGENVVSLMPVVYTPTVGEACQKYGLIFRRPRGLFITIHDKDYIYGILKNWPESDVRAIVVTDGERILGLGDLGAYGMGIPVGKIALYTALGGIKPHQCLPITLDVGTNNEKLMNDPHYIGLKRKRVTGDEYDDFIDEFMKAVVKRYGQNVLIQFEDFANHNALRLLQKYKKKYCTFNDDIQGTASVVLAGLLSSLKMEGVKNKLSEHKFLFFGAGSASLGIAELLVKAMDKEGVSEKEARSKIWLIDRNGLIVNSTEEQYKKLQPGQQLFAHKHEHIKNLLDIVANLQPSVLIGAAGSPNEFTPEVLQEMAKHHERPIILPLSNPTSQSECTAQEAYENTKGKSVFGSGSPFKPVTYNGQTFYPSQANNAYIFPGVALGIISAGIRHVDDDVFLDAAEALSNLVTDEDLKVGRIYPPLEDIKKSSIKIAVEIVKKAFIKGGVSTYPEPEDKEAFVTAQLYNYNYQSSLPPHYTWPNL